MKIEQVNHHLELVLVMWWLVTETPRDDWGTVRVRRGMRRRWRARAMAAVTIGFGGSSCLNGSFPGLLPER